MADDRDDAPSTLIDARSLPPPARRSLLVLADGVASSHPLPDDGKLLIGRAPRCQVVIDDRSISREHAVLHVAPLSVEDLGSANGTRVRGVSLKPHEAVPIAAGEVVDLGSVTILVQERPSAIGIPVGARPGESVMDRLHQLVDRVAPGTLSVLLLGETGVGKEVLAERIHRLSPRASKPFVKINCAALTETLLESELFGHEKGAFTGAALAKPGLIEMADGGTLFLDEVGEMPMSSQVKLLRVIEERQLTRVGSVKPRPVDVRFLAATNRDLEGEVARGTFRADLYFRLNGITLVIPPLRERLSEIPDLARAFTSDACRKSGRPPVVLTPNAIEMLGKLPWPGNIRELRNVVERAVLLCERGPITASHLPVPRAPTPPPAARRPPTAPMDAPPEPEVDPDPDLPGRLRRDMEAVERQAIQDALSRCGGNQTEAAKLLGISRRTLSTKLDAHKIARPRKTRV